MLKNILKVLSANGIVALVGLVSSLLLPKVISVEDYAQYQAFTLYLSYIAVLHLGFPTGMCLKYAGTQLEDLDKSQYKAEMRVLFCILTVFSIIGVGTALGTRNELFLYVAFMIFPYCFLASMSSLMQAWGRFQQYSRIHIVMSALPLLLPLLIFAFTRKASGLICILSYVIIYFIATIRYAGYHMTIVKGIPSNKLWTKENWKIEKLGIYFLLGNYINSLIHSVDKQFVNWFCAVNEFSYYSFALTMQNIMTIFITAVSQPLFPYMASGKVEKVGYSKIKRLLFFLGSFSGIAYFACEIVVRMWIPNYSESLSVIRVYFAVFPAMAIINSLYFNMYKTRKMTKRYIVDLSIVLLCAIAANFFAIKLGYGYIGVAFVTTAIYYLWLIYGTFIFREMKLSMREYIFLIAFLAIFYVIPECFGTFEGIFIYFLADVCIFIGCFPNEAKELLNVINKSRIRNKGE